LRGRIPATPAGKGNYFLAAGSGQLVADWMLWHNEPPAATRLDSAPARNIALLNEHFLCRRNSGAERQPVQDGLR